MGKPHFCIMKNLIALSFISFVLFSCNEPNATQNENVAEAEVNSDTLSLVQSISNQIRQDPKNPDLYIQRAQAHLSENMFMLALEDVERALSADSAVAAYHALKGEIHYLNKAPEKAVESFETALELDPENTDALLKMAEIKLLLRQYQQCFDLANAALRVNEQLYMAYFIKGYAHFELGDSTLFVSSVQTALELNPEFFDGYTMLGAYYASLGDDIAIDYYNSALDLRPGHPEALYGKAIHLQNTGRTEEAVEIYQQMIDIDEESLFAWYNQGYILLEVDSQPTAAIPFFEKAVEINPNYVDAIYNIGLSYERLNQPQVAVGYYQRALEVDPQYDLAAMGMERLVGR